MGKRQHQQDKLYITHKEWSHFFGGKRPEQQGGGPSGEFKRLPFDCCAISFTPFEHPVCTPKGVVYELLNIMPYLKKFGTDPATGEPLEAKALTRLHFHKNGEGKYHCPVTFKVFNENTHIVAVKTSGNVYCQDAIETLNIKPKNWKDLLTDEPFARKDLITLQDPSDLTKFNMQTFFHLKNGLQLSKDEETSTLRSVPAEAVATMAELKASEETWRKKDLDLGVTSAALKAAPASADKSLKAHFSTGEVALSFTSTHMTPRTAHTAAAVDEMAVFYKTIKEKGYVQLRTNMGNLNVELHCDLAPRACDNFMRHCQSEYYNGTFFHRLIRGFMVQGGDPTGTGTGGISAFDQGLPFADEFTSLLSHSARGVLSMANAGPATNKSQFFITFRPCAHLDRKHTVFGRVVGGMDTLDRIEEVEVDGDKRPKTSVTLLGTTIFTSPYENARARKAEEKKQQEDAEKAEQQQAERSKQPVALRAGVGKYMASPVAAASSAAAAAAAAASLSAAFGTALASSSAAAAATAAEGEGEPRKKRVKTGSFGDFSGW